MTPPTIRRWLVLIGLALGIGAAIVGTPARHAAASRPSHSTGIRGC